MAMSTMQHVSPFTDSAELLDEPEALRERAERDGYLFVRGLLPAEAVLELRREVAAVCQRHGLLDPDSDPAEARVDTQRPPMIENGSPEWCAFYHDILRLRGLHALNRHPRLVDLFGAVFDAPVLPHPRCIARAIWPQCARFSTPPHQDYFYIGGSTETWTAWVPLGPCPDELGGLALIPGSHRWGQLGVHRAEGAGGHGVAVDRENHWVSSPFAAGDVLCFHSLTVHQGKDNKSGDRLRLSVDLRYQAQSEPVAEASLHPHQGRLSWEDLYAGWPVDDPLRYWWRDLDLRTVANEPIKKLLGS